MLCSFLSKNLRNSPPLGLCTALSPRNLERGKTLPLAMTGCRHEGRRGAFVLLGSRWWVDQSWTHHHHRPNAPSLNPFDKQPRTQSWELHIVGKWVAIFPAGWKRNRNFYEGGSEIGVFRGARIACRESRRCLSVGAAVLFGLGRSMEWRSANTFISREHYLKQCKYFDRPWA